jgi:hypothetical protein
MPVHTVSEADFVPSSSDWLSLYYYVISILEAIIQMKPKYYASTLPLPTLISKSKGLPNISMTSNHLKMRVQQQSKHLAYPSLLLPFIMNVYDIIISIFILYYIMTGSISSRLVDLIWIKKCK